MNADTFTTKRLLPLIRTTFDVIHRLKIDGEDRDIKRFRARVIERIVTQPEDSGQDDIDYLMEQLQ